MNVSALLTKDYERNVIFAAPENKPKTNPNKPCPERSRMGQFKPCPERSRMDQSLLHFSCAQHFLANTIYGILPNFPRQTFVVISGVKVGLLQSSFFSVGRKVFAANLYNFRLSQKLAEYQTFLKFSDHYCRYQY